MWDEDRKYKNYTEFYRTKYFFVSQFLILFHFNVHCNQGELKCCLFSLSFLVGTKKLHIMTNRIDFRSIFNSHGYHTSMNEWKIYARSMDSCMVFFYFLFFMFSIQCLLFICNVHLLTRFQKTFFLRNWILWCFPVKP